jgi:hypothetical protein
MQSFSVEKLNACAFFAISSVLMSSAAFAQPDPPLEITGPGHYIFRNNASLNASDFSVKVKNPPPYIDSGASSGGSIFPEKQSNPPYDSITYYDPNASSLNGIGGIPPGGYYGHSFIGWPASTIFQIYFSYGSALAPPGLQSHYPVDQYDDFITNLDNLIAATPPPPQDPFSEDQLGQTALVPTPLPIFGAITGVAFSRKLRKRIKGAK